MLILFGQKILTRSEEGQCTMMIVTMDLKLLMWKVLFML